MKYAIEILKQEAVRLSGEIVAEQLLKKDILELGDATKFAYDMIFGNFISSDNEADRNLVEIIQAIKTLKGQNDT